MRSSRATRSSLSSQPVNQLSFFFYLFYKNHGHGCTPGEEIDLHVRLGVHVMSLLSLDPMQSPIEFNAQSHRGTAQ
jgi:hypothetical protein